VWKNAHRTRSMRSPWAPMHAMPTDQPASRSTSFSVWTEYTVPTGKRMNIRENAIGHTGTIAHQHIQPTRTVSHQTRTMSRKGMHGGGGAWQRFRYRNQWHPRVQNRMENDCCTMRFPPTRPTGWKAGNEASCLF
jgi:hypothetical protein